MVKSFPKSMGFAVAIPAILFSLIFSSKTYAERGENPGGAPVVTLQMWDSSSEQEQYAFLAGVISMFELEKEWQGQKGLLPLSQSMIGSWGKGMDGMSITRIRSTVNNYSMNHPKEKNRLVLDVLWGEFVQPQLKKTAPAGKNDTSRRTRDIMESQGRQSSSPLF